ncbi:sel1 repeat family protein (plasmid) [Aeromonas media]|nr:sel1 repeat family protein [Aeromonas media]
MFNDQEKGQTQIHEGELYISQAALAGHADALVYAAQRTISGIGIFVQDEAYAFELYGRAAKLGHPAALSGLGLMYLEGVGCEASPIKAAQLTLQAAQAGFPQAQYNLAVLFMNGTGVPKSETDFIHWLEEAAAQDYPCAVYQLACLIRDGRIPNRPASDAEAEFERAMEFDEFHIQDLKKTLHLKFLLRSCSVSIFAAWFDGHFSPSKRQPIPDALLFPPTPDEPPLPITGTTRFRYFSPLSVWINRPPSASELPVFSSPATTGWPTPAPRQWLSDLSQSP